jgi:hypothetical protein
MGLLFFGLPALSSSPEKRPFFGTMDEYMFLSFLQLPEMQ